MAKGRRKPRPRGPAAATPATEPRATAEQTSTPRPRRPGADERPPAPWGTFPLVELVVAVALVTLVAGFVIEGSRGSVLLITGFALGSLAGLELSVREHFSGYRSHTTLLASVTGVATMLGLYYLVDLAAPISIAIGAATGIGCGWLLVRAFRDRAGRSVKLR